jgi:hypothetical protein
MAVLRIDGPFLAEALAIVEPECGSRINPWRCP